MNHNTARTDWLQGMQLNQPWAFDHMYNLYVRQVYHMVKGMVSDKQAAEDITSEAFIKTFNAVANYPDAQSAKSFLFTVARNAALNLIKINKRHDRHHENIRHATQEADNDAERKFIASELMKMIHEQVEALPTSCREIIRLSLIEEKTISEISDALNISYKTVQNQKTKGMQMLRNQLLKNKLLFTVFISLLNGFSGKFPSS